MSRRMSSRSARALLASAAISDVASSQAHRFTRISTRLPRAIRRRSSRPAEAAAAERALEGPLAFGRSPGVVQRGGKIEGQRRALRGIRRRSRHRFLETDDRTRVLAAVEQAARLLGKESRGEPVVLRAESDRTNGLVDGGLLLEAARQREHPRSGQRRLHGVFDGEGSPEPLGLVQKSERAVHATLTRESGGAETQGSHRFGGRRFGMHSAKFRRPPRRLARLALHDCDLGRAQPAPAPQPGIRVQSPDDPLETPLRLGRAPADDLPLGLDRFEPGGRRGARGPEARREMRGEGKPRDRRPVRECGHPALGLAQRRFRPALLEQALDAQPRIARGEVSFAARRGRSRGHGFEESRRKRRVARGVRRERRPEAASEHSPDQRARPMRVRRRGGREPLVEPDRAGEASAGNPGRSPPFRRGVGSRKGSRNDDHLEMAVASESERMSRGLERAARNRVPCLGLHGDPAGRSPRSHRREGLQAVGRVRRTIGRREEAQRASGGQRRASRFEEARRPAAQDRPRLLGERPRPRAAQGFGRETQAALARVRGLRRRELRKGAEDRRDPVLGSLPRRFGSLEGRGEGSGAFRRKSAALPREQTPDHGTERLRRRRVRGGRCADGRRRACQPESGRAAITVPDGVLEVLGRQRESARAEEGRGRRGLQEQRRSRGPWNSSGRKRATAARQRCAPHEELVSDGILGKSEVLYGKEGLVLEGREFEPSLAAESDAESLGGVVGTRRRHEIMSPSAFLLSRTCLRSSARAQRTQSRSRSRKKDGYDFETHAGFSTRSDGSRSERIAAAMAMR